MNQILFNNIDKNNLNLPKKNNKSKKNTIFKFQFIICTLIAISTTLYYFYYSYKNNEKENVSKKLLDNFNISTLYNENTNYSSSKTNNENMYISDGHSFSVIGLIEIKSIKLNYPIISTYNDELLKIAPCRFYGPMPNEVGNLCIAGHNYNSYKFFSKLKDLSNGDIITIYDLSGNKIDYSVYKSYEIDYNDLTCTNQDTNGKKEITLITCNNIKNKRRVIKATEKV